MPKLKVKLFILSVTSITILVLDQWTKWIVHTRMRYGESIPIIDDFFAFTYIRNKGAAFGILHSAPSYFRDPFFIVVPVVALSAIFYILYKLEDKERLTMTSLSLIVGGAIGNLIDRVRFGYVIDFLDFHWKEYYHWPAFNIADSAIVIGVGIFFVLSFFQKDVPMESKG